MKQVDGLDIVEHQRFKPRIDASMVECDEEEKTPQPIYKGSC
jgi:hypothetical protein